MFVTIWFPWIEIWGSIGESPERQGWAERILAFRSAVRVGYHLGLCNFSVWDNKVCLLAGLAWLGLAWLGLSWTSLTELKFEVDCASQVATSVIIQLRLGGRGYAPDPSNRLLEHVKGLGLLTDLMSKLQQLLEDTECRSVSAVVYRSGQPGCH